MSIHRLSRRKFVRGLGLGAAAISMPGCLKRSRTINAHDPVLKPNIIFMMADDLGYGDLGCYGQKLIRTPQIDRMAREGIRFTECYTGSTVCAPSRSVLMTGLHTGHTRVRGNTSSMGGVPPEGRVPLEEEDVTVAEILKEAGYATGITGKWGLGEPGTPGIPNRKGFDQWLGYLNQRHAHTYYPEYIWHNEEMKPLEGNRDGGREQYSHDLFTDFALTFIREHKDEPFFLYLPWCIPHDALEIPEIAPYAENAWTDSEKIYAAMVTRMDRDVGRILDLLHELALDRNTILFFCSDNGAARRWEGRFESSGTLRGNKRDLYEGGIRTPMVVRWKGTIPEGIESEAVWWFTDILPTFAALAGAQAPEGLDGWNVLPAILGQEKIISDRFLYWEFYEGGFKRAARFGKWKILANHLNRPMELYDLSRDPGEQNNVAGDHPSLVASLEEHMKTARFESPLWPSGLETN